MATFTYTPSFEATEISKPRVVTFEAGDGYQHRVGFGLHRNGKEWQLNFLNRTDTERDNITAFLDARAGVESFDWTPPSGTAGKYICREWQTTLRSCNFNNITATFIEVFEP
jgi:phage-related protein